MPCTTCILILRFAILKTQSMVSFFTFMFVTLYFLPHNFLNNSFDNSIACSVKFYLCLGLSLRNHSGFSQVQFSLNKQAPWCSRCYSTHYICFYHPPCLLPYLENRTQTFVWTCGCKEEHISYLSPTFLWAEVNVITFLHLFWFKTIN